MIGWLAIIIGILVLLGICWYHRKTIRSFFVKNKKKISAVAVAGGLLGVGTSTFIIPEGYRPNTATMITNSNGRYWAATGANIQLAIDDLGSGGGTVWLPADVTFTKSGDYDIANVDGLTIIGSGKSTNITYTSSLTNENVITITNCNNIVLKDFLVYGDHLNTVGNNNNGIRLVGTNNTLIDGVYVYNTTHSSIHGSEHSNNITIKNCHLWDINKSVWPGGVWIEGDNCIIKDNFIKDTWSCGVILESANTANPSSYNIVENNVFYGEMAVAVWMEGLKSDNATISGNIIKHSGSTAYGTLSSTGIMLDEYSTASNNIIDGMIANGTRINGDNSIVDSNVITNIGDEGIRLSSSYNAVISNNVLEDIGSIGIYVYCAGESFVSVIDNNIKDCSGIGISGGGHTGTNRNGGQLISDNTIRNVVTYGIYLCENVIGNRIYNTSGTGYGIYYCQNVKDNYIYGGVRGISFFSGQNDIVMNDNTIVDCNSHGIYGDGNNNVICSGNFINPNDGLSNFNTGITTASSCEGWVITNNIIKGQHFWAINMNGLNENMTIKNNNLTDGTSGAVNYINVLGNNNIIKDNIGYDNSTYLYIPTKGSSPYTSPSDGAMYFCSTNQSLAAYWGGQYWYFASGDSASNIFNQDLNTTDDVTHRNLVISDTFNVTGLSEFENDMTIDDASMIIENGAYIWAISVNATGCLVWEFD